MEPMQVAHQQSGESKKEDEDAEFPASGASCGSTNKRRSSLTSTARTARSSSTAERRHLSPLRRSRERKGERNRNRDEALHLDQAARRDMLRTQQSFAVPNSFFQRGISCPGCKRRLRP